jgi:hypothetical protein
MNIWYIIACVVAFLLAGFLTVCILMALFRIWLIKYLMGG